MTPKQKYIKHSYIFLKGRKRCVYVKANSKSTVKYIKYKKEYVKLSSMKKYIGGDDVFVAEIDTIRNFPKETNGEITINGSAAYEESPISKTYNTINLKIFIDMMSDYNINIVIKYTVFVNAFKKMLENKSSKKLVTYETIKNILFEYILSHYDNSFVNLHDLSSQKTFNLKQKLSVVERAQGFPHETKLLYNIDDSLMHDIIITDRSNNQWVPQQTDQQISQQTLQRKRVNHTSPENTKHTRNTASKTKSRRLVY